MGKKHKRSTHHEYISSKQEHAGMKFRVFNYFVLLSMLGLSKLFEFNFTTLDYTIVIAAIVGYDVSVLKKYVYDKVAARVKH